MPDARRGFSIVTGATVSALVNADLKGCMDVVREAYLAHARGQTVNPPSFFLRFPDKPEARIIGLPAHIAQPSPFSGIKWISSFPRNIGRGEPRASAVLVLNDHENGFPFTCIEASVVSAARTAGSAVLFASSVWRGERHVDTAAIVGTGFIASNVYRFLIGTGWRIEHLQLFDLDAARAQRFAGDVCDRAQHASVTVAPTIAQALKRSQLIVFTTVSATPHVDDPALFEHNPVVLHVSLRDLAPELLLRASNFVDDIDHVMHADTSPHLAEKLTGSRDFVSGTIADVIEGRREPDRTKPVIFSPFGLGVLDLAVGKWIYDRAVAEGRHIAIDDFFCD